VRISLVSALTRVRREGLSENSMSRSFRVRINRPLILANLAREDGRTWSDAELDQLLRDAGFTGSGDTWMVAEEKLSHLDPSEVVSADVVDQ
jgi:hypothetical protein